MHLEYITRILFLIFHFKQGSEVIFYCLVHDFTMILDTVVVNELYSSSTTVPIER